MTQVLLRGLRLALLITMSLTNFHCGPDYSNKGDKTGGDGDRKSPRQDAWVQADAQCKAVKEMTTTLPLGHVRELEKRFLDAHNEVRRVYKQSELKWDASLAAYAHRWAQYLKDNNQCKMMHRSHAKITEGKQYGENLAYNWISTPMGAGTYNYSPERVVKAWSEECIDYNYQKNSCTPNEQCGHFTQVIWHNSERVGCGMVTCDGAENKFKEGRVELWVCSYDPPGNYIGQWPY